MTMASTFSQTLSAIALRDFFSVNSLNFDCFWIKWVGYKIEKRKKNRFEPWHSLQNDALFCFDRFMFLVRFLMLIVRTN